MKGLIDVIMELIKPSTKGVFIITDSLNGIVPPRD